jgi:glycosyltransferase involved in cell wall biosynthesis
MTSTPTASSPATPARIACVQNGNYPLALRTLAGGGGETYQGQRYTVDAFENFVAGRPHLIVSLDADKSIEQVGTATYASVGRRRKIKFIPARFTEQLRARRIIKALRRFNPTHLVLRYHDLVGCEILQWAKQSKLPTAMIIAATFRRDHPPCLRFCALANADHVAFVANHNRVSTASLIDCGLNPAKAIAWDLPPSVTPNQFSPRQRVAGTPLTLMFAGAVLEAKGVTDLVRAAEIIHAAGKTVRLHVYGDGPERGRILESAGAREGWISAPGRVGNDRIIPLMREADLVVTPSRHGFAEGLPFVIQEALASRTPLLLSDHPVFANYFQDGAGVRFFPAEDAPALAAVAMELADDPAQYTRLSEQSAAAWQSFQIDTKFHDLLNELDRRWRLSAEKSL